MIELIPDRDPDLTSETGVEMWFDETIWAYMKTAELEGYYAFICRHPDGKITRCLVDEAAREVVFETQQLEVMGVHIDQLVIQETFNQ